MSHALVPATIHWPLAIHDAQHGQLIGSSHSDAEGPHIHPDTTDIKNKLMWRQKLRKCVNLCSQRHSRLSCECLSSTFPCCGECLRARVHACMLVTNWGSCLSEGEMCSCQVALKCTFCVRVLTIPGPASVAISARSSMGSSSVSIDSPGWPCSLLVGCSLWLHATPPILGAHVCFGAG